MSVFVTFTFCMFTQSYTFVFPLLTLCSNFTVVIHFYVSRAPVVYSVTSLCSLITLLLLH